MNNEQIAFLESYPKDPQVNDGDTSEYFTTVLPFLESKDFSKDPKVHEFFKRYMDKSSFIDYYAAEIYICNWDWPANNMKWLKSAESTNQKLQWIAQDLDMAIEEKQIEYLWIGNFYKIREDIVAHHQDGFFILNKLMENQQFRIGFF